MPFSISVKYHSTLPDSAEQARVGIQVVLNFELPLSVVATIPGSYTGPASRAYLYYTSEFKNWAPGLKVNITPR